MITLCQFYTDFKGASNTWQRGNFRPQSFEYALHEAQMEIYNALRKEWEKSQIVDDNLRYFFLSKQIPIRDFPKGGMIGFPEDYSQFSSLRFFAKTRGGAGVAVSDCEVMERNKKCRPLREEEKAAAQAMDDLFEYPIDKIDNARWGAYCQHEFIPPSLENPGCTQYNEGFKVLPKKIGIVVLDYLAVPQRPRFIYTRDAKHNIICDPDKCTNLLWGDEILPELMSRVKTKYASFIQNGQKYAEGVKETQEVGS